MSFTACRKYLRRNPDLAAALAFALITIALAPAPPASLLASINLPLLGLLFCLMSIVAGLRQSGLFSAIYLKLFHGETSSRTLGRFFIFSCFFSSMLITNDVALIIFVPLAILVLTEVRAIRLLIPVVIWQTIAANMGSMLTPIGNPQNLFIYSYYGLPLTDFLSITGPIVLLSGIIIYLATYLLQDKPVTIAAQNEEFLHWRRIMPLLFLFTLCLLNVLRLLPFAALMVIVVPGIALLDRKLFREVDYKLLLLFTFLFLGVGSLARIPFLQTGPAELLAGHEFLVSLLMSQVLSNVPTTVMLAQYTTASGPLLLGVNIGGLGTIIASMASVISFKAYQGTRFHKTGPYLSLFTLANLGLLAILLIYYYLCL
ncbi:Na+/H+ antiporter NhaD [Selenomonas sp. GACV-9]|uniref:SLC13 family permease n=1 Tax=Selenomonas sp. GACV-9 TaxID=3158782 RepID=UPI0008E658A5|nr:Na+/H+ antiporter NhaD [Selenomonas ruminantium]